MQCSARDSGPLVGSVEPAFAALIAEQRAGLAVGELGKVARRVFERCMSSGGGGSHSTRRDVDPRMHLRYCTLGCHWRRNAREFMHSLFAWMSVGSAGEENTQSDGWMHGRDSVEGLNRTTIENGVEC
jgi:hypothetical protein